MDCVPVRHRMVEAQIARRGVQDAAVLEAMRNVPREAFIAPDFKELAYEDCALPIAEGQTISQPYIVGAMLAAAGLNKTDMVLEVGAGSGYAAAVISRIAGKVVAIERQHDLVEVARERLQRLGFDNVEIVEGDGTKGWPEEAPFDAILAAASGSHVPQALLDQLAPGGRIVMPIGSPGWPQELVKVTKRADGGIDRENLGGVRFVPLIGEEGWKDVRD